jgi:hypothetical protein
MLAAFSACSEGSVASPGGTREGGPDASLDDTALPDAATPDDSESFDASPAVVVGDGSSDDVGDASLSEAAVGSAEGGANDAGSGGCPSATALLCEGFETGKVDASTWTSNTQEATLTVDTMHVHSGTYALHIHASADAGADATLNETKTFPAAAGHFFGRVMMWMDAPSPQSHATYAWASDKTEDTSDTSYTLASQYQTVMALADFGGNETYDHSATALPTGGWACYEWEFDGTDGKANFWLNSTPLTDIAEKAWGKTQFTNFQLGFHMWESDAPNPSSFDLWYDDLVIDTSRVGCP